MRIQKNDTVLITKGRDRGKIGTVITVISKTQKVVVKIVEKKNSDFLHKICINRNVESLNISNSASIIFHYLQHIKSVK